MSSSALLDGVLSAAKLAQSDDSLSFGGEPLDDISCDVLGSKQVPRKFCKIDRSRRFSPGSCADVGGAEGGTTGPEDCADLRQGRLVRGSIHFHVLSKATVVQ